MFGASQDIGFDVSKDKAFPLPDQQHKAPPLVLSDDFGFELNGKAMLAGFPGFNVHTPPACV